MSPLQQMVFLANAHPLLSILETSGTINTQLRGNWKSNAMYGTTQSQHRLLYQSAVRDDYDNLMS